MLLLCSRYVKVVILNLFVVGINAVSLLPVFLSCVFGVCNSPVATPAHGFLGLIPSLRLQVISENASLLCIFMPPPRSHFT